MNISSYQSIYRDEPACNRNAEQIKQQSEKQSLSRFSVKLLVSMFAIIILFTCFKLIGTNATTSSSAQPQAGEEVIIVHTGETLWSIAGKYVDESQDIRYAVHEISKRNLLESSTIISGQKLIIPQFK